MITVLLVQGAGERAGAERMLLAMLHNIDRSRVRPVVAFLDRGPFVDEVRRVPETEVLLLELAGRLRQIHRVPQVIGSLRRAIRDCAADVVHCFGEKVAIPGGIAARMEGVPCVVRLHDTPASMTEPATAVVQTLMAVAPKQHVVTCSDWLAEAFNRRYRLGAQGVRNGIDVDALPPPGAGRADLLAATGFEDHHVVFAQFGRLQSWKGVHVFLRAAEEVARRDVDGAARFAVVGGPLYERDVEYAAMLPGLATVSGLGSRVRFLGHRADALHLMSGCDVVVHASTRPEPLGNVVLEAMGTGRALIASRSRGPEETVVDGATGILTDPGDHEQLAAAMLRLLVDADERRRFGAEGVAHTRTHCSVRQMTQRFEDLWLRMARRSTGPTAEGG